MSQARWIFLAKPRGGHHYWLDTQGNRLALCDDSAEGRDPSHSDDGVLYIDTARPLAPFKQPRGVEWLLGVAVLNKHGTPQGSATANAAEAHLLVKYFGLTCTVPCDELLGLTPAGRAYAAEVFSKWTLAESNKMATEVEDATEGRR